MNDSLGMPQSAVVIGGTSDIAGAVLRLMATRRLRAVLLTGRDEERMERVGGELTGLGVQVHTKVLDVTDVASHRAVIKEAAFRLDQVDLVLLAAGELGPAEPLAAEERAIAELFETNCTGPASLLGAFARLLVDQGCGRLVVISSVAGVRVRPSNFAYGASKAGLDAFAQGLDMALSGTGVSVTIVRPGWVDSRMTRGSRPAPFATTPDAVALDVVAGLERGASVVWSPPVLRAVFALARLVPSTLWRRLPA